MAIIDNSISKIRLIFFIIILVTVCQLLPYIIKTRFACDINDCIIERKIFGSITISKHLIGRNQIVNFSNTGHRTGKSGRIYNVYLNTRTGEKFRIFTGSKNKAHRIYKNFNEIMTKDNFDITD